MEVRVAVLVPDEAKDAAADPDEVIDLAFELLELHLDKCNPDWRSYRHSHFTSYSSLYMFTEVAIECSAPDIAGHMNDLPEAPIRLALDRPTAPVEGTATDGTGAVGDQGVQL
jgi:hypothetical protein